MSINVYDIGVPLIAAGFTQDEIVEVLNALEQDKIIAEWPIPVKSVEIVPVEQMFEK